MTKWITAIKLAGPDSKGLRTMELTLDADYAGELVSVITLEATDEHDRMHSTTFTFKICGACCKAGGQDLTISDSKVCRHGVRF